MAKLTRTNKTITPSDDLAPITPSDDLAPITPSDDLAPITPSTKKIISLSDIVTTRSIDIATRSHLMILQRIAIAMHSLDIETVIDIINDVLAATGHTPSNNAHYVKCVLAGAISSNDPIVKRIWASAPKKPFYAMPTDLVNALVKFQSVDSGTITDFVSRVNWLNYPDQLFQLIAMIASGNINRDMVRNFCKSLI